MSSSDPTKGSSNNTSSVSQLAAPFLGTPIEICLVTPNIYTTLAGLVRLGIGPFKIFNFNPTNVSEQKLRVSSSNAAASELQPASFELKVAFAEQASGMIWEVMQPVSGDTLMQRFLDDTNGKGGIHHVAFDCGEMGHSGSSAGGKELLLGEGARKAAADRRAAFESRGFPLGMTGVWNGKKGTCEFLFFETGAATGVGCFETYVFSDDWEEPEEGVETFPNSPQDPTP
jgi:methylmalonyl-CoA/ethylmalonyl-CoA epimerase